MSHHKDKYLDFPWVLAMMDTMIEESTYHTKTFSHTLIAHHNDEAAKVFNHISEQFKVEQSMVLKYTLNVDLPNIPPWEEPYDAYEHPASLLIDANYLMNEAEAWKIMHGMIEIHQHFYNFLLKESTEENVIHLAKLLQTYCHSCEDENKVVTLNANSEENNTIEDLDIFSLHSLEGGLW